MFSFTNGITTASICWKLCKSGKADWRATVAAIDITIALILYKYKHPNIHSYGLLTELPIPTAIGGSFIRFGNFFNSEIVAITQTEVGVLYLTV
jgi:hypothetical protein